MIYFHQMLDGHDESETRASGQRPSYQVINFFVLSHHFAKRSDNYFFFFLAGLLQRRKAHTPTNTNFKSGMFIYYNYQF